MWITYTALHFPLCPSSHESVLDLPTGTTWIINKHPQMLGHGNNLL